MLLVNEVMMEVVDMEVVDMEVVDMELVDMEVVVDVEVSMISDLLAPPSSGETTMH